MRAFRRMGISLAFIAGCASETVPRPAPPPVAWQTLEPKPAKPDAGPAGATSKERAAADAYMKALSGPSLTALGGIIDEDAHFSFAGQKDVHGRDSTVKMHESLLSSLTDRSFAPERIFSTESAQIIEWIGSGTRRAGAVTFRGLAILSTRDDGAIANIALYFDEALPPPNPPAGPHVELEQARSSEETANVGVVRAEIDSLESRDAGASMLRGNYKSISHLDVSPAELWGVGPYVVAAYYVTGEQKNDLVKLYVVDVIELHDGKITAFRRYANAGQKSAIPR